LPRRVDQARAHRGIGDVARDRQDGGRMPRQIGGRGAEGLAIAAADHETVSPGSQDAGDHQAGRGWRLSRAIRAVNQASPPSLERPRF
jgi:hypothetical protein